MSKMKVEKIRNINKNIVENISEIISLINVDKKSSINVKDKCVYFDHYIKLV